MESTLLHVKVVPGASRDRVAGRYGEGIKVQTSAPPEGGRATRAVEALLAAALGLQAQQVRVVKGHATQRKVVEHLVRYLNPGGYLMLGHSESIQWSPSPVQPLGTTIFQLAE